MIEKTILDYLGSRMSVPVYMERPKGERFFVLIQKVGGSKSDQVWTSTLEFEAYGGTVGGTAADGSLLRAAQICEELIGHMDAAADSLADVARSHYGGSYNATFASSKEYRYKAIYEITHY